MPLGGEFRVNSYTTSDQTCPSVASDASGNFVVVWQSFDQDGSSYGIFGQRYDSAGVRSGGEFRVNSLHDELPELSLRRLRRERQLRRRLGERWPGRQPLRDLRPALRQRGRASGGEFRVNSYTTSNQHAPSVASDASGNFVVVWQSFGQDGSCYGIFGQRYDSAGVPQGDEFRVNSYTTGDQAYPSVASDASGNFVVVWHSYGQDGSGYGIFGQRYDSAGVAQGGEFQDQLLHDEQPGGPLCGRHGHQPVRRRLGSSDGQDGSGYGVFGQRFDFGGGTITVVSPNTNVKWRIGSLQKIQWTHNLGADATFRIELDRDDDGDYEELIAAAAPVDSATKGSFAWTVTGPPSGTARVRVAWTDDLSVSDSSDVTFQIRPVGLD